MESPFEPGESSSFSSSSSILTFKAIRFEDEDPFDFAQGRLDDDEDE